MLTLIAELSPGAFAILAAVGLMICMLLVRSQKQIKAASGSRSSASAQPSNRQAAHTEMLPARHFQHWEVRMHEVARELSAQLDSKMVALELLVREAQEQIVRLERLTQGPAAASPLSDAAGRTCDASPPAQSSVPELSGTQAAALPRSAHAHRPHALPRSNSRRHQEVYALADAGQSSADIAQQLDTPIGEVELILGLRRAPS